MSRKRLLVPAFVAAFGLVAVATTFADKAKDKAAGQPDSKLPFSAEEMQAFAEAGTPGEMHKHLAKGVGKWSGKNTVWMAPDSEPVQSECTSTVTSLMDGRFVQLEMNGEMPGMGPFEGMGIYGYDNIGKKFQCTWIGNCSTGMMIGTGELSSDGKTTNWKFTCNCPITKKSQVVREIETITGPNTKTIESFATDPKSGKEYKMMQLELTRKEAGAGIG